MTQKRGLTYPLTIINGTLATSEDLQLVEEHILSVLETRKFERVMRADYGLPEYIFDPYDSAAINAQIYTAVMDEVTELTYLEVRGDFTSGDTGMYNVVLNYYVEGTPQPPLSLTLAF